jgi:integrase
MRLTQASVQRLALPAEAKEKIWFDGDLPGFGLRLRKGGKRTWIAQYRIGAKQRRVTIGTVKTTPAEEARKGARRILARVHLGADPQIDKVEARAQASATLRALMGRYLDERAPNRLKPRSLQEVQRHLRNHWSPIAELPIKRVTRADVAAQLARLAKHNGPFAANRARAALSAVFSWAIGEGLADANPVVGTNKPTEEIARDRVLTDAELSAVWRAADEADYGAIVKLLILTGQRREEVGRMLWSELHLDEARWSIDASRTKNSLPHDVPLSAPAAGILHTRFRREGRDLVFGSRNGPFQGWSNAKAAHDARTLKVLRRENSKTVLKPWRLHDIRRTVATGLGDIGVQPHVVEAILNHISGRRAGVAGVYNRATYAVEKRAALDRWAARVLAICEGASEAFNDTQPHAVTG